MERAEQEKGDKRVEEMEDWHSFLQALYHLLWRRLISLTQFS